MDLEAFTLTAGVDIFSLYIYIWMQEFLSGYMLLSGIPGFIHRPIFNYNKYFQVILHSRTKVNFPQVLCENHSICVCVYVCVCVYIYVYIYV